MKKNNNHLKRQKNRLITGGAGLILLFALLFIGQAVALDNIRITVDSGGPDDVPAQTDVSLLGFDDSHLPDYFVAQMQFDDTVYPGGNSGDGCIFFDSDDAGGFSDFAVCGSFIQNTTIGVVELQSAALYDCKGSEPNNDEGKRCGFIGGGGDGSNGIIAQDLDGDGVFESDGDGNPLGTPYDTTCSLNTTALDPFNGVGTHNTSGEQDPITDTQLTCIIYADELVELDGDVPSGIVVSNACSFTSPDPSSESKDCVVDAGAGFLQIVKNIAAGDPDATFDFTLDGAPFASITTAGGTGSTDNLAVDGGTTYNLAEVVPAGWQLDSATCDNGDDPNSLTVEAAITVVCTFENSVSFVPDPVLLNAKSLQGNADEDGSGTVSLNDTLTYLFVATNDGNVELTGVNIVDPLPGLSALSCDQAQPATLAVGASLTCTATYVVTQTDVEAGVINNTATADSDQTDPVPDSETVPVTQNPALAIDKALTGNADEDASGTVSLGDTLEYTLIATNTGDVTLNNVTVSDDLTGDSTSCLTVAPGSTCVLTVTYVVTQADVDAGEILNTGVADSDETPPTEDPEDVPVPQNAALLNAKSLQGNADEDGSGTVSLNDTLTYLFVATNDGNVELTGVNIVDPLPGLSALSCDQAQPATLAVGASLTCTATYVVTQTDVEAGVINNTATADSDQTDPVPDSETVPVTQNPALAIDKALTGNADEDASGTVSLGDTLEYTLIATNTGDVTLNNVTVSDDLTGDSTSCLTVAPGSTCVLTVTYVVTQADVDAGEILNTGVADSDETPPTEDPEDVPVPQNPALAVDKALTGNADEDASGTVSLGDTLEYTLIATNTGDVTLNNVIVSDDLTGDSTSCLTVAPGSTCVLTVTYVVTQADVDAGEILNTGVADSDETPPTEDPEDVPVPQNPALAVDKALTGNADEDASGTVSLGDTLEYTLIATNTGDVTLNNVIVSDDLTGDSTSCLTVAPGSTCVLTVTYVVTQADVDAGEILNTGVADSDETPPTEDPEDVPVPQNPALAVDKALTGNADEDASGTVSLGDTLEYTLIATNTGDVTLNNVTVSDDLTGDSTSCLTVAPGSTCVLTVTYVVTQADVDAGEILNTGVADSDETPPTEDPEDVPVPQNPALAVDKALTGNADEDASGTVSLGDTLEYTLIATNTGDVTLNNVTVSDDLTGDSTSCLTVAPGSTCVLTVTYVVTQADVDAGEILNTGVADSDETPPTEDPEDVPVPQNPSINLIKSGTFNDEDGDGFADIGETISYNFTVTNDGDVTLTDVTLADTVGGVSISGGPIASLAVGASDNTTFSGSYTLTQADIDSGNFFNLATVSGEAPGGDPGDPADDVTDNDTHDEPLLQNPSILADKVLENNADEDGNGDVSLGDTLSYRITATNDGNVTLTNVSVDDDLTGTTDAFCAASLAPDTSCSVVVTYVVTQADVDAGQIDNLGTVEGTDPNGDPQSDDDPETVDVPQNPSIDLLKSGTFQDEDGDGLADVGETIAYNFTVTNDGNVTLTDVTLADTVGGVSISGGPIATLAVSASDDTTFSGSYTITQADIDSGSFNNVATATGTDPDGDPTSDDDNHNEPLPQNPSLNLVKTGSFNDEDGDGFADVGETIAYNFTVTNDGNVTLTDVALADTVGGVSISGGPITTLTVGASDSSTFSGSYTITQTDIDNGSFLNVATATGTDPNGDPTSDNDDHTEPLPQNPSINLVKSGSFQDENGDGFADVGETIAYNFTVTNDGNVTLTDVTLADTVGGVSISGGPIATLAVGASNSTTFSGSYTLTQADIDSGAFNNVATATGTDPNGDPTSDDDSHNEPLPQNPSINLIKTGSFQDENGDGFADVGETIAYNFTVTNDGNVTLTDVTLADTIGGVSVSGGPITTLAVNAADSTTFAGSYTITQDDIDNGSFFNLATTTGTDPNGEPTSDTDTHTELLPQNPSIVLVKTGTFQDENGDGFADVGETIAYNFTVTNDGNVTLTDVTLADTIGGVSVSGGPIASLAVGASNSTTFSGSYTLTQADIDSGAFNNVATATGTDPNGDPTSDDDSHNEPLPQNPSINLIKTGSFQDENGDGFADVGETIAYNFTVTNDGNVTLTDVTLADTVGGVSISGGPIATLAVGASDSTTFSGSYTLTQTDIDAGHFENVATVTGIDPNGDPTSDTDSYDEDLPQNPVISIVKTFADDTVIAGGPGSSFTLVVTNEGNVTLSDALIEDAVDSRLTVTGVSGTDGADADTDGNAQTVEWLIATLGVGESATITVDFTVDASVPEANGVGGVNDADNVPNTATVAAEAPLGDPGDPGDDIIDSDDDIIDILTDIDLSIVKTFDPTEVPQGTNQSFTIEVSNAGPSDAVDVSVIDLVDDSIAVTGVSVTSGSGDCSASAGQQVDCTVQIPAGTSVTITVDYTAAPFLSEPSPYGTLGGDDFRIVFLNGSVLEGSTAGGPVFLDGVDITNDVTILSSLTRNDIIFDPSGPDQAFEIHLSCSDPFTGGWGQSGGPVEGVDVNWQIAFFSITRYNNNGFIKACGNVVNPFMVPNIATATGEDSSGTETVSDDATLTIGPGITIDRLQTKGKRLTVRLTNFTGENKVIEEISVEWPESNGNLTKVWLTQDGNSWGIWDGNIAPPDTILDSTVAGWNGATLLTGEGILRFDFKNKVSNSGYIIRVNFTDGTFLDINVGGSAAASSSSANDSGSSSPGKGNGKN